MGCNCKQTHNISMGCCQPVLAPIENYYTKYQVDQLIESATTSGCCITPEEVDDKISSAITEIEGEIPVVPTSNSAFTNDEHYITSGDSVFNNYALTASTYTKQEVNTLVSNKIWCGTETEYNNLSPKQNDVLYLIHE